MLQSKAHTRFDRPQRNMCTFGNLCMSPSLEISKLDHQPLFCRNLHQCCTYLRTLHRLPGFIPNIRKSRSLVKINLLQRAFLHSSSAAYSTQVVDGTMMQDRDEPTICGACLRGIRSCATPYRNESFL